MAPHNSVIQTFVELGVIGLVLWLRLWILSWRSLAQPNAPTTSSPAVLQQRSEQEVMSYALRISLVALFVAGFFLSQAFSLILWQIFAVCAATGALSGTQTKASPVALRSRHYKLRQ